MPVQSSHRRALALGATLLSILLAAIPATAELAGRPLEIHLQTRDPKTNKPIVKTQKLDPAKVGIVIVDLWNYHWCKTWTHQTESVVPRMNRVLQSARKLGMPVLWAPTDVASQYVGTPQRERALAVPYHDVPKVRDVACRFTVRSGPCHCGPGIACGVDYGHDGMHPDLVIADEDLIVSGTQELYSICKGRGITHLVYLGGATNICLTGKPTGLGPMWRAGLECMMARDLSEAWTHYDPGSGHTPDVGNAQAVADLERAGIPTVQMVEEMTRAGAWDSSWVVDPVRITPWGKRSRPHLFERSVTVTLTAPWLEDAAIHYTLDGSPPTPQSPRYDKPLVLEKTTEFRAAAFRAGRPASLPSEACFVRLGAVPPEPDVYLDQLQPVTELYARASSAAAACFWHPKRGTSFEGKPLRTRRRKYEKGLGCRAPSNARYLLKPEYDRFVALAGIDDNMLDVNLGRFLAMHPSMVFRVFIDGRQVAESPVMRMSQEPWRFDVKIPEGARQIDLAVTDAGSRSAYDLGNWVRAGFVLKKQDGTTSPTP